MNRRDRAAAVLVTLAVLLIVCGALAGIHPPRTVQYTAAAPDADVSGITVPRNGIDVNHATAAELDALPGIGPVLAQAIIDEREADGPYYYPEDVLEARGIGPTRLAAISDMLEIGE